LKTNSQRLALITGATRTMGIGAAAARELARAGLDIFFTTYTPYDATMPWGVQQHEPAALLAEVQALGVRAAYLEIDLAQPDSAVRLFDHIESTLGSVDVLVNNAAYSVNGGITDLTAEMLDRHYAVNMRGMMLLCREFVRRWQKISGGRIINLTSGQGLAPMPEELAYAATKGAVEAFTLSLSAAVMRRGITVNALDPGATDTGWIPPDLYAQLTANSPAGRVGQPEDAARLIRFLASDEAAWITGQIIHSRGGM
jgi:3-oxoacyl-[acyl-carrier protein] reductase